MSKVVEMLKIESRRHSTRPNLHATTNPLPHSAPYFRPTLSGNLSRDREVAAVGGSIIFACSELIRELSCVYPSLQDTL